MEDLAYLLTATLGSSVGLAIIFYVRRDRLIMRHGLSWLLMAVTLIFLGLVPEFVDAIAAVLGVDYPPTLAVMFGFAVVILKALIADIELSAAEVRVARLVQRLAILESEVRALRELNPSEPKPEPLDTGL